MTMRIALLLFTAAALIRCGKPAIDYRSLHAEALVADLHCDGALRMIRGIDFAERDSTGHMDFPRLREGGIDLQVFACWLSTSTPIEECRPRVDELIDSLDAQFQRYPDEVSVCRTAAEAERIIDDGRIAAFIGIENGVAIADDLENLQHFYDRGVRYMTLTHTASNDWCISSADTAEAFHGLTDFGRDVVRKMNTLGMIVDISHASPAAVEAVLEVTSDPVIASHSCVHAICDHNRNLTDDQIRAVAANGGLIGINFYNGYLSSPWREAADAAYGARRAEMDSLRELYADDDTLRRQMVRQVYQEVGAELRKTGGVDVGTVVDHIDYIVKLVGPDYVGLGSDYDGVSSLPTGLTECSMMPNITRELVRRGYREDDIMKILGGNFMRVFRQVCDL